MRTKEGRDKVVAVRLSADEEKMLSDAAHLSFKKRPDFIREAILKASREAIVAAETTTSTVIGSYKQ